VVTNPLKKEVQMKIRVLAVAAVSMFALAGCETENQVQGTAVGAAAGAAVGGLSSGSLAGAAVGAATGAVAGNLIARVGEGNNQCIYQDRNGNRYRADCPS
jgi:uncharacterized protein YcfJ